MVHITPYACFYSYSNRVTYQPTKSIKYKSMKTCICYVSVERTINVLNFLWCFAGYNMIKVHLEEKLLFG